MRMRSWLFNTAASFTPFLSADGDPPEDEGGGAPGAGGDNKASPPSNDQDGAPPAKKGAAEGGGDAGDDAGGERQPEVPAWVKKQTTKLRNRLNEEREAREAAERRLAELEAAQRTRASEDDEPPPEPRRQQRRVAPVEPVISEEEINRRAQLLSEQQQFARDCNDAVERGRNDFGKKQFDAALDRINEFSGPDKIAPEVMTDIIGTDNPAKVLWELSRDPEKFEEIMDLPPHKRRARFVALSTTEKPKAKGVSEAPLPTEEVQQRNAGPGPIDLYDKKFEGPESDEAWYAARLAQKASAKNRPWSRQKANA